MSEINVTKIAHFTGHTGAVYTLCMADQGDSCFSGAADGYVVRWNANKGGDGQLLVKVNRPVYSLCYDAASNYLYCGVASGNLHVINLDTNEEIRNIEAHQHGIFDLAIHENYLISAGGDGQVKVWDRSSLKLMFQLDFAKKSARSLAINIRNNILAVGYSDHHIRIFSLKDFTLLHTIAAHNNSVFTVAFTPDGNELLSGGRDALLKSWIASRSYEQELDIPAHILHINHISFSPQGDFFITASMDKTIKVWGTQNMQLLKVIDKARYDGHLSSVNRCVWLTDNRFATCSDDRTMMVWEMVLT